METVTFRNESGNVLVSVRNAMRDQAQEATLVALQDAFGERVVANANGGFSIALATDENGDTIYFALEGTVTTKDPSEKRKTYSKKSAPAELPEVPELF